MQLAESAAGELKPFGFSFIQIDDKWQDGVERNGPARRFYRVKPDGPYPNGIKPVAEKLHELGGDNAPFHDPNTTNIEALRDGLKLLRQAAGPDVFFSGCNLSQNMRSLAGCIGLVDSMRIGPDKGQGWRDYRQEIARNASGSIITGPVRGTRLYLSRR